MNATNNYLAGAAASQLIAIEVISELLISTSPQKLGEVLTEHLRELTGAKTAMVLARRPEDLADELLHVSPLRRGNLFSAEELKLFSYINFPEQLPYFPGDLPAGHPVRALLSQAGVESMARFPLNAAGGAIGLLLLFDLPGIERFGETTQIIQLLAPPIALALKNAFALFQIERQALQLEKRVEERTDELFRKNLELQKSEERQRTILQTAMEGFWLVDAQRYILESNDAYCQMSGFSRLEIQGRQVTDFEAQESDGETAERARRIIETGADHFESKHRRKDGSIFPVEISIKYLPLDGGRLAVFMHDITERKRAEEQLRGLSHRLQLATSSARLGVWDWNVKENVMLWDDRMFELYGVARETFPDSFDAWIDGLHPEDGERVVGECRAALDGLKDFDSAFRVQRKDGTVKHLHANALVVRDAHGAPERMTGINADVTEMIRAGEENAKLENQLHQAQKMESIGRLAGGVAHDFNNMLTVIIGHADLALLQLDPADPVCDDLQEIYKAASHSADLTRQLLAFARKQTITPKSIDLNDAISGMLKMLGRLIGEDVELTWKPGTDIWQVRMDPSQIDQILANICVNARDAIDDAGCITIETANVAVDAEYCSSNLDGAPGEYVRLSIGDDGNGMDKETLSHIFEPFYTTKEMGRGTGLGLAMVFGAVKQNNGFINVYSEPGRGTIISIYLPREMGDKSRQRAVDGAAAVPRGRDTILLVEDEPAILRITAMMLEKQGYSVLKAETPGAAMLLAREHVGEIDLLMTDVIMPEMNGRDLAKKIQALYPQIKRLFMSGYTADVIAHHGVLDDAVHFIQKPFTLPDMAAKVREALDG